MLLKPGQNFAGMIATAAPDTGAGADPTVITGALYRNGVVDAAVAVVATDEAATAGITSLAGTIPVGYAEGDVIVLIATATVGGVSSSWPVWHASIVAKLPGELLAAAGYTAPDNAGIAAIAGYLDTEVAAIKAKTDLIPAAPAGQTSIDTLLAFFTGKKVLRKEGLTWYLAVRNAGDTADILKKAIKDKDGNNVTDLAAGAIAQELASEV